MKPCERIARIELAQSTWKDDVLPLNYIRTADHSGFEPETLELTALCSAVELVVNISIILYDRNHRQA